MQFNPMGTSSVSRNGLWFTWSGSEESSQSQMYYVPSSAGEVSAYLSLTHVSKSTQKKTTRTEILTLLQVA